MKSSEIKAIKHADFDIVKIISGGVVLWDSMINVVVVGDYQGLPADKIREIVETNKEYRLMGVLDYSNFSGKITRARVDLDTKLSTSRVPNRLVIVLTPKTNWTYLVGATAISRGYAPYHLLEKEIMNGLSDEMKHKLYLLAESTGINMEDFVAAAKYMKELREK